MSRVDDIIDELAAHVDLDWGNWNPPGTKALLQMLADEAAAEAEEEVHEFHDHLIGEAFVNGANSERKRISDEVIRKVMAISPKMWGNMMEDIIYKSDVIKIIDELNGQSEVSQ